MVLEKGDSMSRYYRHMMDLEEMRQNLADLEVAEESFRDTPIEIGSPAAAGYAAITEAMSYFHDAIDRAEAEYR